jgi:hypothetical protein
MARQSHLTTAQFAILNHACIPIREAFGPWLHLVGSVTERSDFRDVDLRLILPDDDFDRLFGDQVPLWSLVCLTVGEHISHLTGLPIDFQIQRMTEANEKNSDGTRIPMGMKARPFAGGGDATPW